MHSEMVRASVIQREMSDTITLKGCLVEVKQSNFYCGMHSHISFHDNSFSPQVYKEISTEDGQVNINGHIIL